MEYIKLYDTYSKFIKYEDTIETIIINLDNLVISSRDLKTRTIEFDQDGDVFMVRKGDKGVIIFSRLETVKETIEFPFYNLNEETKEGIWNYLYNNLFEKIKDVFYQFKYGNKNLQSNSKPH